MENMTKENAKKFVEIMKLDEDKVANIILELEKDLKELREAEAYTGSVALVSHNTILALKYKGEVSHIITQGKNDRGMINLGEVDRYLSVPRYEPKVAKEWLAEELVLNSDYLTGDDYDEMMSNYEKYTLGERELRGLVIKDKEGALDHWKRNLEIINIAKEA